MWLLEYNRGFGSELPSMVDSAFFVKARCWIDSNHLLLDLSDSECSHIWTTW